MTYFEDLSRYSYIDGAERDGPDLMVNVGWLDRSKPFAVGYVEPRLVDRMIELAKDPWNLTRGRHLCNLCPRPVLSGGDPIPWATALTQDGEELVLGNGEIHVQAAERIVYSAPTLIVHYVESHQYLPPDEFLGALG